MIRQSDKRERLLQSAKSLIYQQGYRQTTLADIAEHSGVPLGNVYYYFRTKDDIAAAVIKNHQQDFQQFVEQCEKIDAPMQRIVRFVDMILESKEVIIQFGCPIGSLCMELKKYSDSEIPDVAETIKTELRWLVQQFENLGLQNPDSLSVQLMVQLQGMSVLASALNDGEIVEQQSQQIKSWLENL